MNGPADDLQQLRGHVSGIAANPSAQPADPNDDPPNPMTDDDAWFALHDRDKVEYTESVLGEMLSFLDAKLDEIDHLQIEVEDPEGYVRFTVGADGRLVSLFIHEAARTQLTNLELEQKFSDMLAAAHESWEAARNDITNTPLRYSPPPRRQE